MTPYLSIPCQVFKLSYISKKYDPIVSLSFINTFSSFPSQASIPVFINKFTKIPFEEIHSINSNYYIISDKAYTSIRGCSFEFHF